MQQIIVHLKSGSQFTFTNRDHLHTVTLAKVAKELRRSGCVLLGDDDNEVLLFEREIEWIRREVR